LAQVLAKGALNTARQNTYSATTKTSIGESDLLQEKGTL